MKIKLILGFTLATLLVIFAIQNAELVSVKFIFWKLDISRALLILLSMAAGAIISLILTMSFSKKGKKERIKEHVGSQKSESTNQYREHE